MAHLYDDLSAYQTYIVTQDQNSVTEDVTWESTSCSSPDFLKNDDAVVSPIEGEAANISGITDDYTGTIRQGNPGYLEQVVHQIWVHGSRKVLYQLRYSCISKCSNYQCKSL
ncbi:MAG: hypothetical protein IPP34_18640 [Bacteroidetes bacterium]|nr:hypothetical protein [Bacteroidota bacterium]